MNNKVILALLFLINLGNPVVNGMEYVKNSYSIQAHNPILRSLGDFNHLLCNRSAQDIYSFSIVNGGTTLFGGMFLDNSFKEIYDFEIHNDSVFFCGIKTAENGSEIPIMGYFDMASFPYSAVEVVKMPWIKKLYKLDVSTMADRTHVVMVGIDLQGNGIIVDAIYNPTYWDVNYTTIENTVAMFEDVAITDEYVVATSGYIGQPYHFYYGRLWFFNKPTASGDSLFPQTAQYINTGYTIMPPFLIDRCKGDTVVVAARCGDWTIYNNYTRIGVYAGPSPLGDVSLLNESEDCRLKDIRYHLGKRNLEIAIRNPFPSNSNTTTYTAIYTLTPSMLSYAQTAYGHSYDNVDITTVYRAPIYADHFVAAGCGVSPSFYLFAYNYMQYGLCMNEKETEVTPRDNNEIPLAYKVYILDINIIPDTCTTSYKELAVENKCYHNKQ